MSEINYEVEVKKVYPDACHVWFENANPKHHIRLYGDEVGLPKSLGKSDTAQEAWKSAYEKIKSQIK